MGGDILEISKRAYDDCPVLPSTYLSDTSHMTERSFPNRQNRPAAHTSASQLILIDIYFFFECLLKLISIIYLSFSVESWSLCALTLMWMKENPLLYRSIYLSIYTKRLFSTAGWLLYKTIYARRRCCFLRHTQIFLAGAGGGAGRVVMHDSSCCCSCFFFISPFEALVKLLLWWAQAQS